MPTQSTDQEKQPKKDQTRQGALRGGMRDQGNHPGVPDTPPPRSS